MVLSSFLFSKMERFFFNVFSFGDFKIFSLFIDIFFSKANVVFWLFLILGSGIICVGLFLYLKSIFPEDKKFSVQEVKELVKEEVKKYKEHKSDSLSNESKDKTKKQKKN